jgi:hypothetical protein
MLRDVLENAVERARPQGIVLRQCHVVLAPFLRREAEMRALLPGHHTPEGFEQFGQFRAGDVAR